MKLLLDTCVLYPTVMREVLLKTAQQGLFTPLWSARILEEWARAARKLGPTGEPQARAEIAVVRASFPKAEVPPHIGLENRLWLPDKDDIHVLAAAIGGNADAIVTLNAGDFPRNVLKEEGLERIDPDSLLIQLFAQDGSAVSTAAEQVRAQAEAMSGTPWDMRKLLKKARLPRLGKALAP
ncbi:RSP_2648 family PIN domain-containing protein [Aliiroseovarius sp. PTFE2010]|uniref:RSP_2648 family PIN domain-containing protein n=1 Tax=Aliiroseovarius sp. PTFE2010 TaxID=3417190 RepID=UPI003CF594DD